MHHRAKRTPHEVELLRQMVESGEITQKEAAEKFELSKSQVSKLVRYLSQASTSPTLAPVDRRRKAHG